MGYCWLTFDFKHLPHNFSYLTIGLSCYLFILWEIILDINCSLCRWCIIGHCIVELSCWGVSYRVIEQLKLVNVVFVTEINSFVPVLLQISWRRRNLRVTPAINQIPQSLQYRLFLAQPNLFLYFYCNFGHKRLLTLNVLLYSLAIRLQHFEHLDIQLPLLEWLSRCLLNLQILD